jgi:hypothetical protein
MASADGLAVGADLGAALFARHNSFIHQSLRRLTAPKAGALPDALPATEKVSMATREDHHAERRERRALGILVLVLYLDLEFLAFLTD